MLCLDDGLRSHVLFWGMLEVGSGQEVRMGSELGGMYGGEVAVTMYCMRKNIKRNKI